MGSFLVHILDIIIIKIIIMLYYIMLYYTMLCISRQKLKNIYSYYVLINNLIY